MPPGRTAATVDFWISVPDADKVTLRWSEDDWKREFELVKTGDLHSKTLYPLKYGQKIEFKFLVWKGSEIEWTVNRQIRVERTAAGFENNVVYINSD